MKQFRLLFDIPGGSLTLAKPYVEDIATWKANFGGQVGDETVLADVVIRDHKEENNGH